MLVALLLQAAIAGEPAAQSALEKALVESLRQRSARLAECNRGLIYTKDGLVDGTSLYRPDQNPARAQQPLYKPGEFPEEGVYAAVERRVDGCPIPTPISYRNKAPVVAPAAPIVRQRITP